MITTGKQLMAMQYRPLPCPECGKMIHRTPGVSGLTLRHDGQACEAFRVFTEDVIPGCVDFFALFTPDPQS